MGHKEWDRTEHTCKANHLYVYIYIYTHIYTHTHLFVKNLQITIKYKKARCKPCVYFVVMCILVRERY